MTLQGSIDTPGGRFEVTFAGNGVAFEVTSGRSNETSTGGSVHITFYVPNASPGSYSVTLNDATRKPNIGSPPWQFTVVPNQCTIPEPVSVAIGAVAGAGVVSALAAIQVLAKNSAIRALEEELSQLRSRIRSQSPSLGSFNVEVRSGVRRLEDSP